MRFLMIVLLLSAALAVEAQSQARPRPPGTTPLEEPPPPPLVEPDPTLQPQVTIRREEDKEIAEYRVNGKLYMVRITPKNGKPYTMIDHRGDGTFSKQDNTLSPHVVVPQWVLVEF
jgi:uncharacterized protein DUF2782